MTAEGLNRFPLDNEDLLEGWKAIADHLDKTERTVQRWEKSKALPVRRLKAASATDEQGRVFAYKSELDAWWQNVLAGPEENLDLRADLDTTPPPEPPILSLDNRPSPPPKARRKRLLWIAASLALVVIGVLKGPDIINFIKNRLIPAPSRRVTLTVRPFKDLDANPSEEFVAAGLTEEMVTRLGQLHPQQMLVVRLTSGYADAPPEKLAKDIRADYVLEGGVRKIADRVAITAQLIQINSQSVVWGQHYEREVKDLLRVQDDVAAAITGEVLKNLPNVAAPAREVNREAYLAYLQGRYFWNKRTTQSLMRARELFQQSIDIDPSYAPSYAGLSYCYELLGSAPYTALPPNQAFPKAKEAAKRALELDNTLAEAHVALGYSEMVYDLNFAQARQEFSLALQLHPDYATGHQFYGYYLTSIGDLKGAIAERKRALELDPVNPLLATALGEAYYHNREFDRAIEQNSRSLELDPSYAVALVNIGRAYEMKGMHPQAQGVFQKILTVAPDDPAVLALMGHEYASAGDRAKALQILAHLKQLSAHGYVPTIYIGLVYTGLHDLDNAFQWLNRAADEHCEYLVYLPSEPLADPLRGDPRFDQLLKRMGLKPLVETHSQSE
jgi:TolB-like protein/Tfp pilus assembly protein PilF